MTYFLYGDDTYRSWQKLQSIKQKYLATAGDTDLATLEGATLTADDFRRQTQTTPFLATSRLVIIKNLLQEGKKEVAEAIVADLPKVAKTTVLFFYEQGQPDKRTKLFQTLNQPKQAQAFELLVGPALQQTAAQMAVAKKLRLSTPLLQKLLAITGPDLWRLDQELEKMALYAPEITPADFNLLISDVPEARIFDLTDAFGNRESRAALSLLDRVETDESGLGLLAMVAGHYRNLLLIADGQARNQSKAQLASHLKLHPFVLDKSYAQARRYGFVELSSIYRYLLQLDLAAKQSLLEPKVGLTILAAILKQQPLHLPDLADAV